MLAVVPQQAVRYPAQELLGPERHLLVGQRQSHERVIHGVEEHGRAVREILQGVHTDGGALVEHAEKQPLVVHCSLNASCIAGQRRQYVGNQVGHLAVAQIDAEVDEESARDLQQVATL